MHGRTIEPKKEKNIPTTAQWLSGEGCGAWFHIEHKENNVFIISRYNTHHGIDFTEEFTLEEGDVNEFDSKQPFKVLHISHARKVQVEQETKYFLFKKITV